MQQFDHEVLVCAHCFLPQQKSQLTNTADHKQGSLGAVWEDSQGAQESVWETIRSIVVKHPMQPRGNGSMTEHAPQFPMANGQWTSTASTPRVEPNREPHPEGSLDELLGFILDA